MGGTMRPLHISKLTYAATTAITVIAVALPLSAAAQGATLQQKVYGIFTKQYRAELAFTPAHMQGNVTAAQQSLAATAGSIDTLSSTNDTAATALIDELENQYDMLGTEPLFKASLAADEALAKLPLTHAQHKDVLQGEAYDKRALGIDTATDLAHWQSSNFVAASEPVDTKQFGGIVGLSLPSIDLPISGTTAAIKTFTKLENKASARVSSLLNTVSDDWSSWIAAFGVQSG
jgi:hypothetical protein